MCNQLSIELYFVSMAELDGTIQLSTQELSAQEAETDLSSILIEYYEFADLFSKKEVDNLPPHRPYDHMILLEPGKAPPFGPIYKLSPAELEAVCKYIEDNIRKGFLHHSQSLCGAPIVFA